MRGHCNSTIDNIVDVADKGVRWPGDVADTTATVCQQDMVVGETRVVRVLLTNNGHVQHWKIINTNSTNNYRSLSVIHKLRYRDCRSCSFVKRGLCITRHTPQGHAIRC